jgi:hypothetical protein
MLIGDTPELSAALRITLEQSADAGSGSQRIHGLWSGTTGSTAMGGNFSGSLASDGRMQFILTLGNNRCNFRLDVGAQGSVIEGTYGSVGPNGCIQAAVSVAGRVQLTRE